MPSPRKRADVLLVERGLFESRARAQAAIEAGLVTANDKPVAKASESIPADAVLQAQPAHPFVSRGGVKLAGALEHYPIEIEDHVCLDVGASTGGFTEVLLANGASLVFSIDVGRGQLHPSLHGHPKIVSMEETDIRGFEGKRLPHAAGCRRDRRQLHFAESRAAGGAVAGGRADASAGADQAAIRGASENIPSAASSATRRCIRRSATTSRRSRRRSAAPISRCFRPRSRAATAISNSSSARAVAERLAIDHVGHRGDGVGFAGGESRVRAVHAGRRNRRGRRRRRSSRPPALTRIEHASPQRIAPFCRYFGVCGGCAIQHWQPEAYRAWKRGIVVETLEHAGIACEVDALIDAHGAGRRRITVHARRGSDGELRTGFAAASSHAIVAIDDCPILDPGAARRARRRAGAGRSAEARRQAARYPGHRGRATASTSMCAAPARCRRRDRDAVRDRRAARPGAADPPWRTGADAHPADDRDRRGASDLAAGLVPAGDRRRRRSAGGAGDRTLQARQTYRRSVLRGRTVRAAARGKSAGRGVRQRCRRGRGAAEGGDLDLRAEAGQGRGARPVPASADAAGTARLRHRRVRSAAAGRAGAGPATRGQQDSGRGRGVLQRRDLRARCARS